MYQEYNKVLDISSKINIYKEDTVHAKEPR